MGTGLDKSNSKQQQPRRTTTDGRRPSPPNSSSAPLQGRNIPGRLRDYPDTAPVFDRKFQDRIAISEKQPSPHTLDAARVALEILFGPVDERSFAVQFWDGHTEPDDIAASGFTLKLNHPGTIRRMLRPPFELSICQAYIAGDFDIVGDVERAASLEGNIRGGLANPFHLAKLTRALLALPTNDTPAPHPPARAPDQGAIHTPQRDAAAVRSHYDVGNDFYQFWLDKRMVYSCGYFATPDTSLDDAQEAKLDHICRKLRLTPGETLLDVGCGWGGLIMHAAERFGVRAVGITLSYEQAAFARERIEERGLSSQCSVEIRDYRHLSPNQEFDKISSVGMVEHVGVARLPVYFEHLYSYLRPGGLLLNHGIVHAPNHNKPRLRDKLFERIWGNNEFINRYVFPDGELPELSQVIATAEAAGFETRDAEALREHYTLTLRHWVSRLERARAAAVQSVGEEVYRIWRLYMAASAYGFSSGRLSIDQLILAKPTAAGAVDIPRTRADIYT